MKYSSLQIVLSEILLIIIFLSGHILPIHALWDPSITGPTISSSVPAEYISCPTDHEVTEMELATIIGITTEELIAMKRARSLTNTTICQLPKARIARALKKTKDPSQPSIEGFMAWRNESLISGTGRVINAVNANNANVERQALVVNDGPLVNNSIAAMPQGIGAIDKTRWFPLGPNNISGRIITMLIDPDHPDTLWVGSAGGGLWKSIDNGNNWNPVADFPGNTAISVIKMDPHDHNVMYIGTGDKDGNYAVPGKGIFKSIDRGITWIHVPSTSIIQNDLWKKVTDIYIDTTIPGRFIVSSISGSGTFVSEDDMQTWQPIVSGTLVTSLSIVENPFLSGYIILSETNSYNQINRNFFSKDYGKNFTEVTRPFSGRAEIAFGKPNIITVSGESISATNKKIRLQNNANSNAHIDTLNIHVINTNPTVSGELCIRPLGSTDSCSSYSGQIIDNTGGLMLFSGSSLVSSDIPGNGGLVEFELLFDSVNSISPGDITLDIDQVDYTTNNQLQVDRYIQGQSFGSGIIYASVDENLGNIYRSADLGNTWELVSSGANLLGNQGWYGNTIWVNPFDNQHIIIGGIDLFESRDGGYIWRKIGDWSEQMYGGKISPHADHHSIVSDPRFDNISNKKIYFGTDGGIYRADDITNIVDPITGWSFAGNGLNITQFYSIAGTGNTILGGAQDNGTTIYNGGYDHKWRILQGGDGGDTVISPSGKYIYGEIQYGGSLTRGQIENGVLSSAGIANYNGGKMDGAWVSPMILDPNTSSRMFFADESLWLSENVEAENPTDVIFRNIGNPDPLNHSPIDNIAIGKHDSNRIWVSKGDKLYRSMSGVVISGEIQDWQPITASNLPQSQKITHIEIDYYNPNKIYITYGGYEGSNIWMTENNGVSWVDISANLPKSPVYTIKQFRNNPNYLYVGTEAGLFSSEDGGQSWTTTNEGPANTPVFDIEWYNENTLLIATFGRGAWALDLNNLTIVPPPTATFSGETLTSLSGSQNIIHYKDPIDVTVLGNGTLFYTLDNSVPNGTSSGIMTGDVLSFSGGNISLSGVILSSGSLNTINLRSRDFAGNWSDVSTYTLKYKNSPYITNIVTRTDEPYRANISFDTPMNLSGSILYSTSSGNLTIGSGIELKMDGKMNELYTLTGLLANTRYYYQIQVGGTGSLSEMSSIASFVTLDTSIPIDTPIITQNNSGTIYSSGRVYIVGSTSTGVSNINTQSGILELSDTSNTLTTRLPLTGLSISSSGVWDGTINAPMKITTSTGIQLMSGTVMVDSIYSIGNDISSLSLSGQVATVNILVSNANGATIRIYRSPNALVKYTEIASCVVINNVCTFTTNHFSLFAFGVPVFPSSGIVSGPGGSSPGSLDGSLSYQETNKKILTSPQNQFNASDRSRILKKNKNNLTDKGISFITGLVLDFGEKMKQPLQEVAYSQVVNPIIYLIENSSINRNQKVILYDKAIKNLKIRINGGKGLTPREKVIFIFALQEFIKERRIFIGENYSN